MNIEIIEVNLGGVQGAPGAPGKSAYQLAVDHGFVGTEAEWLASLKGADGGGAAEDWRELMGTGGFAMTLNGAPVTGAITVSGSKGSTIAVAAPALTPTSVKETFGRIKITGSVSVTPAGAGIIPVNAAELTFGTSEYFGIGETAFEATFQPAITSASFAGVLRGANGFAGTTILTITSIKAEVLPAQLYNDKAYTPLATAPIAFSGANYNNFYPGAFFAIDTSSSAENVEALWNAGSIMLVGRYEYTRMNVFPVPDSGNLYAPAPVALDTPVPMVLGAAWTLDGAPAWAVSGVWNFVQVSLDGGPPQLAAVFGGVPAIAP